MPCAAWRRSVAIAESRLLAAPLRAKLVAYRWSLLLRTWRSRELRHAAQPASSRISPKGPTALSSAVAVLLPACKAGPVAWRLRLVSAVYASARAARQFPAAVDTRRH